MAGILSANANEEFIEYRTILETARASGVLKSGDSSLRLRELDISPEFKYGLNFNEAEEFEIQAKLVELGEKEAFWHLLDPDIKIRNI
jgi:hypothetical protein